jgi:hypothetical protein
VGVCRWSAVLAAVGLCAGCAGPTARLPELPDDEVAAERRFQETAQIRDYYRALARLDAVAFRLRIANRRYCRNVAPQLGLRAASVQSLPRRFREFSAETLGTGWTHPTVLSVVDNSPAALADIRSGDEILALDNDVVPARHTARWIDNRLASRGEAPVTLMIRRGGRDAPHTLRPLIGCAVPVELAVDPLPNAFADDERIVIHSGILRLAKTDAELAVIVGHELAHLTLGHLGKRRHNALLGKLGGMLLDHGLMTAQIQTHGMFEKHFERVGALAYSIEFEREADYVGAYYAARAGYDISAVPRVWRALALESPGELRVNDSHPTTPARFVHMQKTIAEIKDKQRRGLPLEPDLKSIAAPPEPPGASPN